VAGGVVLAWGGGAGGTKLAGALAVAGACACWAVDNNLTRQVSASDPVFIAATKGLVAGITNVALALALGAHLPAPALSAAAMGIGFAGYGVSLVLFVLALRGLGSARTGAYFSTAPFVGAAIAIAVFNEPVAWQFWLAGALMAAGVWLHLTEVHQHEHVHEPLTHTHAHRHDAHHQHEHSFDWDGREPHTHEHSHACLVHRHPHYPDVHHRHGH
jgi:drug/metabolite transporter (DMT)-like permease